MVVPTTRERHYEDRDHHRDRPDRDAVDPDECGAHLRRLPAHRDRLCPLQRVHHPPPHRAVEERAVPCDRAGSAARQSWPSCRRRDCNGCDGVRMNRYRMTKGSQGFVAECNDAAVIKYLYDGFTVSFVT